MEATLRKDTTEGHEDEERKFRTVSWAPRRHAVRYSVRNVVLNSTTSAIIQRAQRDLLEAVALAPTQPRKASFASGRRFYGFDA